MCNTLLAWEPSFAVYAEAEARLLGCSCAKAQELDLPIGPDKVPPTCRQIILCVCFQLTVGLYEFKVIVDGENAHGEGYVNVTVNPSEWWEWIFP